MVRLRQGRNLQAPQVVRFDACKEGKSGLGGVVEEARVVREDGVAMRPNEWRDAEQRMR